ncbi:MAG: dihydrolipoamide acetyltransferase family protein [Novosphingobium sp.]
MGRYTFRLPDIGEGIAQAEIVAWHVKVGDRIEEDGPLADMMTDKATVEMESPVAGVVVELAGEEGDKIPIGSMLAVIEVAGEGESGAETGSAILRQAQDERGSDSADKMVGGKPAATSTLQHTPAQPEPVEGGEPTFAPGAKILAAPAVRARARALGIDLGLVRPGPSGRIGHAELDAFLMARVAEKPDGAVPATPAPQALLPGMGEQIKVIGLRRRIAEKMVDSKRHIPHFSYVEECDVTALEDLRAELNGMRGERPKLTLLPLLIAAICRALPQFPMINARYDDAAGVVARYNSVHLGVATQTDGGLVVPVIREAQALSLWQLGAEVARLAAAARDGSAKPEELTGSTLTITSLGPLGGIATTPVINRPEVAIIGPNKIVERPVYAKDGVTLERRKLMNLSISCDHRVVDGFDAASFVQAVKTLLERPAMLLAGQA